ncbi:MAG: septal ring lytic transglycosylase RlpA family protein [Rickettsiales bacterium]|nr:septal ring lytic transglycosylase RlpA family protein [Rickettsiales bacterium]
MKIILVSILAMTLAACTSGPEDVSHYPKVPYKAKVGKPYKIMGKWYSPRYDPTYEQTGIASWYGPGFHGRKTATGERYDQNAWTAAHTTLPMPSIVRVTNLENGRAMNLRVNDRGPFHPGRIIDLSKAASKKLGVIEHGVAKVKVTYLQAETEEYMKSCGKRGDELKYSEGFSAYNGMMIAKAKPIVQDIKSIAIERVGKRTSAPMKSVSIASLPDITPKEVKSYQAPWLVQVASYADTVNAQNMMSKLSSLGKPLVQEIAVKGQPYYRVLLKPTSNKTSQFGLLSQLKNRFGISDAKVIKQ